MLQKLNVNIALIWILAGVLSRWLPHPPNFTAVGAVAVIGGLAYSSRFYSLLIPVLVLFLSDLVIGFHSTMVWVYGAVMLVSLMTPMILKKINSARVGGLAVLSTAIFFLVTNFGVWAAGVLYPMSFSGLVQSYVAGLPFALNQLLADLLFIPGAVFTYHWALTKFSPASTVQS